MRTGTADELFAHLLVDGATPSPEETLAFMIDAVLGRPSVIQSPEST